MRRSITCLLVVAITVATPSARTDLSMPPDAAAAAHRLSRRLTPSAQSGVERAAKALAPAFGNGTLTEGAVLAQSRIAFSSLGSMSDSDIMALCFIVMMEAAKSAQEDLKTIMDAVKAINDAKSKQRKNLQESQVPCEHCPPKVTAAARPAAAAGWYKTKPFVAVQRTPFLQLEYLRLVPQQLTTLTTPADPATLQKAQDEVDALSDMSKEMQREIAMYQSRYAKMMELLSQTMKKVTPRSEQILANLK